MKKFLIITLLTIKNLLMVIGCVILSILAVLCILAPIITIAYILNTIGLSTIAFPIIIAICVLIWILIFCVSLAKDEYEHKYKK